MCLLRLPEVLKKTNCSRSFILSRIAEGTFPAPIKLGPQKRAWIDAEINQWIDAHAAARPSVATIEQVPA